MPQQSKWSGEIKIDHCAFVSRVSQIMAKSFLGQVRFARMVQAELEQLVLNGEISESEAKNIGVDRSIVSRIFGGELRVKREHAILWSKALKTWHESALFRKACDDEGVPEEERPKFTSQDRKELMHLAGYATTEEFHQAQKGDDCIRVKLYPTPEQFDPKKRLQKQKKTRLTSHDPDAEPKTDGNIQALPFNQFKTIG